jgi:predicted transglutaminase-like cysteine proteinase
MRLAIVCLLLLTACTPDKELLGTVNTQVNSIHYSGPYPCQQYVKEKHRRLLAGGVPDDDMKVLYGVTYGFKPHVVLEAEGYILDNRYPDISKEPRILVRDRAPASDIEWAAIK